MLKELKTQHRTIIQMVFSGFSNNEIAERLEMSPASVSTIIRSPLGQAYLGGLNDKAQEATLDVRKKLTSLNKQALDAFGRILDPRQKAPHSVQATIAKDILDRNGYKPPDKHVIDLSVSTKTDQEIDAEIAAMKESIGKTLIQDPIKEIAESPKDSLIETSLETLAPAIITRTEKEPSDSPSISDESELVSSNKPDSLEDSVLVEQMLNKIPVDVFDSSAKAS